MYRPNPNRIKKLKASKVTGTSHSFKSAELDDTSFNEKFVKTTLSVPIRSYKEDYDSFNENYLNGLFVPMLTHKGYYKNV